MRRKAVEYPMAVNYFEVLSPVIGLVINILFQVLGFRYIANIGLLKSIFLGFAVGLFSVITLEAYGFLQWQNQRRILLL